MLLAINDIILMIIGIAVMILLFSGILIAFILNQKRQLQYQNQVQQLREEQQNQLIAAAIRSEEIERHRIAEVLHDEVGALLSSSKLHLQGVKTNLLDDSGRRLLQKANELLDGGISRVRGISHNLHSNILKEFGLNEAIRDFARSISTGDLVSVKTELDDNYQSTKTEMDIDIYRISQELMNNLLKHARPATITISSIASQTHLQLRILHDGKGLSQQQFEEYRYQKQGLGLKNILNRIILLKGKIRFSQTGEHYSIQIEVPINPNNHEHNKGGDSR